MNQSRKGGYSNQNYGVVVDSQSQTDFFCLTEASYPSLIRPNRPHVLAETPSSLSLSFGALLHLAQLHSSPHLSCRSLLRGKRMEIVSYVCVERVHALFELIFIYGAIVTISEFLCIFSLFLVRFSEFRYSIIFCTTY